MRARRRLSQGSVQEAIIAYLRDGQEASVAEIRAAVSEALGREVPPSSVRSSLRLNDPLVFTRTNHGRYRLNSRLVAAGASERDRSG